MLRKQNRTIFLHILLKVLIIVSPFILIGILTFFFNPYNFFIKNLYNETIQNIIVNRSNESISRGAIIKKSIEFENNPCDKFFLGDSHLYEVTHSSIKQILHDTIYNFSIPGSNIPTHCDILSFCLNKKKLKEVYCQVSFFNYGARGPSLFLPYNFYKQDPLLFCIKSEIIRDSYSTLKYLITQKDSDYFNSYIHDSITGWIRIEKIIQKTCEKFEFNNKNYILLKELKNQCEKNGTRLIFILPPEYHAVNDFLIEYHLEGKYEKFKNEIKSISKTIDLSMNEFTKDSLNYLDYFHPNKKATIKLLEVLKTELNKN